MSTEYFMVMTKETWERCPQVATDAFNRMLNKEHPDKQFDVTVHHENNLFGPTATVALLAKVRL